MITVGQTIPNTTLFVLGEAGPEAVSTSSIFDGKKVALFGLPGAFTPTCSAKHVPGFLEHADALAAKGIDKIVCISVNDAWVMGAWGVDQGVGDKIMMVGDGNLDFTNAAGLEVNIDAKGFGHRCRRFSMTVNNGVVESLNLETDGGYEVTSAEHMISTL
jgi:peroxiredoxin